MSKTNTAVMMVWVLYFLLISTSVISGYRFLELSRKLDQIEDQIIDLRTREILND